MEPLSAENYALARDLFARALAFLYAVAYLTAWNQFPALLGERGLLPVPDFLARTTFRQAPSLFHLRYSDRLLRAVAGAGILLALALAAGALDRVPIAVHVAAWLALWFGYLSIVNVGQRFYAFGWESMLCEAGFFAAFLGPARVAPSWIPIAALLWMLFRVELGAGLIKLRHDPSWRDLTALRYHHETQPLPNPLSRLAHRLPESVLKGGVAFSHVVQVGVPFLLFLPQPFAAVAGALVMAHQLLLIVAGNYSWLNWLTIVLALLAFSHAQLAALLPFAEPAGDLAPRPIGFEAVLAALAVLTLALSVRPAFNLLSKNQLMNHSWNAWNLVNAYGAFGGMTKVRYEVVLEGTADASIGPDTAWRAYAFRAKPGDLRRIPPQVAPYHLRLDWLMWFLPFSAVVVDGRVRVRGHERWFLRFVDKLLQGDRATLGLLRGNPFPDAPPRHVRARFFRYRFATRAERKKTGCVWVREDCGEFLPPRRGAAGGS